MLEFDMELLDFEELEEHVKSVKRYVDSLRKMHVIRYNCILIDYFEKKQIRISYEDATKLRIMLENLGIDMHPNEGHSLPLC